MKPIPVKEPPPSACTAVPARSHRPREEAGPSAVDGGELRAWLASNVDGLSWFHSSELGASSEW